MEKTWASGPIELLTHATSHLDYESPFDSRIAFVSIDNAVELILKLYLQMPKRFFEGQPPTPAEIGAAHNNFPRLVQTVSKYAQPALTGFPVGELELFHRLRNELYHNPAGYDVDKRFLAQYFGLASELLSRLFGVRLSEKSSLLLQLRADVLAVVASELREEQKNEKSAKAKAALSLAERRGAQIGRRPKELSVQELELAKRLYFEGWGAERIAKELSARRGAHLLTDSDAERRLSISASALKRRLAKEGVYRSGTRAGRSWKRGPEAPR